jgi:peptidoglycan/LPS O-acetylase OafA/YrhL
MSLVHPKYRPDIDGLRAVAVLSVLLFHAFPKQMHGGFIGVDIFFVISGFLISTIIFQSLARGEFSFMDFYARRIRRIFPALIVVMLATFAIGWFVLFPDEYKQLGKHMMGGALFVSNFVLWRDSGYFDAAAETKPLLHLWSLGIEEQFYIIFPLVVWFAWRARLNMVSLIALAGLTSFAHNLAHIHQHPIGTFYLPQFRFWELMAGSMLALLIMDVSGWVKKIHAWLEPLADRLIYRRDAGMEPGAALANVKSWLGMALIVVGLCLIHKNMDFPGKLALLPTAGAVLIIWAGPHAFVNRWVLSNRVAVWFGKISYPLYLWHWPLLVYLRIVDEHNAPSYLMRAGVLVLTILLSWLTYRFIERPIRFGKTAPSQPRTLAA